MELRQHLHIIARAKWFILLVTALIGLATFTFAFLRPQPYKAVVSFDVLLANRPTTPDYQYGTYYDLKGAEIFTQHVMSWFRTPAFIEEVYKTADISYAVDSIAQFTNRFQSKQYSAQNFSVTFKDHNKETALKLAGAISTLVEERAGTATQVNGQSQFTVQSFDPVVARNEFTVWFVTVIGVIAGLLFSLIAVYIREYLRKE